MCENNKKELPVVIQKKFNTNVYHAYPLCILFSNKNYLPWFYENYIQLWGIEWINKWIDIGLTDSFWTGYTGGKYTELLDVTALDYDITRNIPCIRSFIRQKIDEGSYLVLFVDEFFIPTSRCYGKNHFLHEYMVYGYDFCSNTYAVIGFNAQSVFSALQIDVACFDNAFSNTGELYKKRDDVNWLQRQSIVLMRDKNLSGLYPFSLNQFTNNLKMYYDSTVAQSDRYLHNFKTLDINTVTYGMDCYKTLFKILEYAISDGVMVDYKALHLLYENKVSIYDRLNFVVEKYHAEASLSTIITDYKEIVTLANTARLKYLKISENGTAPNLNDKYIKGIESILQIMHKAMTQEKSVLANAIEALEVFATNNTYCNCSR